MKRSPFLVALPWIMPWIIGFVAFLAAPIVMSLWYSLNDYSLLEPAAFVGLDNYKELAGDPLFWRVTRNTLVYGLVSSGLAVVPGSPLLDDEAGVPVVLVLPGSSAVAPS